MRVRLMAFLFVLTCVLVLMEVSGPSAQAQRGAPPANPAEGRGATPATPPGTPQRGGGRGGGIQVMTVSSPAWPSGGQIPVKYTQAGSQVSPPLTWTDVPEGTGSFVLLMRDLNAPTGDGVATDVLHWMLWNIPATTTSLPEGLQQGYQLPDGTRQISVSGPYYRGPGAPAAGPAHHYLFELYAIEGTLNVNPTSQAPGIQVVNMTRANVLQAIAGRVRGKGVYVGLFKR